MSEFDLIERISARARSRDDVVLGIGDDAALLRVPDGMLLAVATDTLNDGVHFPPDTAPADIGWKALAVNLSDLAAMGAQPAWCSLSLSLPRADAAWLDRFLDGFLALAAEHAIALVGGDTTRGPLSICVTVHGFVSPERILRRDGACVGDDIWVTGSLGDAAAALEQWRGGVAAAPALRARLDRPLARVETGRALAGLATAAIDLSDGLLADLGHVCRASGVGAELQLDALPMSDAFRSQVTEADRHRLQASGGDDYELCFTASSTQHDRIWQLAQDSDLSLTRVGRVVAQAGVRAFLADGRRWLPDDAAGYVHFD